jgi:hypothetical protein
MYSIPDMSARRVVLFRFIWPGEQYSTRQRDRAQGRSAENI